MTGPLNKTDVPAPRHHRMALNISTAVICVMGCELLGLAADWLSVNQILVTSLFGGAANVVALKLSKKGMAG